MLNTGLLSPIVAQFTCELVTVRDSLWYMSDQNSRMLTYLLQLYYYVLLGGILGF